MLRSLCLQLFYASGWRFESNLPQDLRSFVFIGAPHTSNYDFIPAMAVAELLNRNTRFVIKNEWLKFPMGIIMRPAGAIGIDRKKLREGNMSNTDLIAKLFQTHQELALMIAPEGTRGANADWKTGFYYIAQKANVPIVLGYADFEKKIAGAGPIIYPQNFEEDMAMIMAFYENFKGKVPENFVLDSRYRRH